MNDIKYQLEKKVQSISSLDELQKLKTEYLGRNGTLNLWKKERNLKQMEEQERKHFGLQFNALKEELIAKIKQKETELNAVTEIEEVDLTLPGTKPKSGHIHPINRVRRELEEICLSMGFRILSGNEVETDYNNFESLNTPKNHPARDMQDTFWLSNGRLLRTQTSANQVQALKQYGVPFRAVFPGKCFRYETLDSTHENTFYQMEGLVVDRDISIANLIAVMKTMLSAIFQAEVTVRLRPGYFPFVEPAFELDIRCLICGGSGCSGCRQAGWLELLPCGLVHPVVLKNGGVDTDLYNGFAFGLGLTRLAMMKYKIPDIRTFNSGNYTFLEQF